MSCFYPTILFSLWPFRGIRLRSAEALDVGPLPVFLGTVGEKRSKVSAHETICRRARASDRAIRPLSIRHAEAGLIWGTASDKDPFPAAMVTLETPSQNLELLVGRTTLTQGHSTPSHGTPVRPHSPSTLLISSCPVNDALFVSVCRPATRLGKAKTRASMHALHRRHIAFVS